MTKRSGYLVAGMVITGGLIIAGPILAQERGKAPAPSAANSSPPASAPSGPLYFLSDDELKYDCKKLTGHLQIRIRQYRSTTADQKTSDVARNLQTAVTPIFGGTQRGINPDGDNARDLSMIKVYNGRLAAKNCATFDLDRLLAPGNKEDPRPIPKAKPAAPVILKAAKPVPPAVPPTTPAPKPQ